LVNPLQQLTNLVVVVGCVFQEVLGLVESVAVVVQVLRVH
jgi:hypothetical protein